MKAADAPSAPQEIELKFEIEAGGLSAVRALPAFAEPGSKPVPLASTYWDTPSHDLARAGLTLRVRREGAKRVQTVKAAAGEGLLGRGEWEAVIAGDAPELEPLAHTPVASALSRKQFDRLVPVFTTRVRRTRSTLAEAGAEIEVSLDEGSVKAGGRKRSLLQLELELKQGSVSALFDAARPLLEAAPLRLSFVTKAASGYRLAAPDRRALFRDAPDLDPDAGAGTAVQALLRSALADLSIAAEGLLDAPSPRAIHQARVAARRLRAALGVAADLGADARRGEIEAEVRWLATEMNPARDLDVFIEETLGEADPGRPEAHAALSSALQEARSAAHLRADQAVRSERFRRLMFEAAAWAAEPRRDDQDPRASDFAASALDRRRKRVRKRAGSLESGDAHALHRFRIAAKKLRYAAEFFATLYSDKTKVDAYVSALKTLQDALGELNDVAVAAATVESALQGGAAVGVALYAGERIGRRAAQTGAGLKAARKAWRRLESLDPFW